MKDIEDVLKTNQLGISKLEVPEDMEARLRSALSTKTSRVLGFRVKASLAAMALIFILLFSFNYDVIAFYGKQLLGYDQVMNDSLKQLSQLGKGQPIGKSITFENGIKLTVDYVMLDENQLLLFYTVQDPAGHVDENTLSPLMTINAFWGSYNFQNSQGTMNDEKTEIKYLASFEPPKFFEKKLTIKFIQTNQGKAMPAEISFTLNRNTAMGHTLKKNLQTSVDVDKVQITFNSILASPTKTMIRGSVENIFRLAMEQLSGERIRPSDLILKLWADGQEVPPQGGGMSTDMKGITFHNDFDPLPPNLKQLQLELVRFGADHDVNQQFKLNKINHGETQELNVQGQKVKIAKIKRSDGETLITISSEESLILSRVYLGIDGTKVPLEQTVNDKEEKLQDGTIMHTRTLRFLGTGDELELDIQRMTYAKNYHTVIEIPTN